MSMNPPATAVGHADPTIDDPRQRRAILIAVCVALMAVIASVTGLNVYTMSLAALLLPLGALGDRRGRKPVPPRRRRQRRRASRGPLLHC
jgi:hypothetical protein